jgi:hypothetical protein
MMEVGRLRGRPDVSKRPADHTAFKPERDTHRLLEAVTGRAG